MRTASCWLTGILLAPFLAITAGIAGVAMAERSGARPFSSEPPRSAAEAAAMGSASDLLRFLRLGDDPNVVRPVRAIGDRQELHRTALEAAVESKNVALVRLIDREGFILGDDTRSSLACLAADLQANDVVTYLAPEGSSPCVPGEALGRLQERGGAGSTDQNR